MSNKILRTPTRAEGGVTPEEQRQMDAITQKWIKNAFRTEPINKEKITKAIYGLYEAAGLKRPRVVIVPSPLIMAFAYGLSAGIWHLRKGSVATITDAATSVATRVATRNATIAATRVATDAATRVATRVATRNATRNATFDATFVATSDATHVATRVATRDATFDATSAATSVATSAATSVATSAATIDATRAATYAATIDATRVATGNATPNWLYKLALEFGGNKESADFLLSCINRWQNVYQGGNMWSYFGAYAEATRDVLGLKGLGCWEKYQPWEEAMKEGGFRVMHEKFCIVSDFPKTLLVDEQNRPHCDSGPSHEWRDGFKLFYLHGVKFDEETHRKLTNGEFTIDDLHSGGLSTDQASEALFWLPPEKIIEQLKAKLVHTGVKGTKLYHVPKVFEAANQYFMVMEHPSIKDKFYLEWVDPEIGKQKNADLAQCYAWQDEDGDPIPLEDYLAAVEA